MILITMEALSLLEILQFGLKNMPASKLEPNPEMWQYSVIQNIEETIPWLASYVKEIVFREVDAAKGAGFGYVQLGSAGRMAGAIMIVRNFELLPIDVFEDEAGVTYPLSERRLFDALGGTTAPKAEGDPLERPKAVGITKQTKPPMDATSTSSGTSGGMTSYSSQRFDIEPRWKNDKLVSGPSWAFKKFSSYVKEGLTLEDAKVRVAFEYLDRKIL